MLKRLALPLAWGIGVAGVHFVFCVWGIVVVGLRAAFAYQEGFWKAPVDITIAYVAGALLSPLGLLQPMIPVEWRDGYAEIAVVSVLFGAAAAGISWFLQGRGKSR